MNVWTGRVIYFCIWIHWILKSSVVINLSRKIILHINSISNVIQNLKPLHALAMTKFQEITQQIISHFCKQTKKYSKCNLWVSPNPLNISFVDSIELAEGNSTKLRGSLGSYQIVSIYGFFWFGERKKIYRPDRIIERIRQYWHVEFTHNWRRAVCLSLDLWKYVCHTHLTSET